MSVPKRLACPRSRKELLKEFPGLAAVGPREQDQCLEALVTFDQFGREVANLAIEIDALSKDGRDAPLRQVLESACRHRIFSLAIPKSLGGGGASMLALSLGLEQLSAYCAGIANLVATHGLALAMVGAMGQLRHLRMLAHRIVEGERAGKPYLLATAATEPSAGSDLEDFDALARADIQSHADPSGREYVLHGRKIYVSNGSIASAYVVVMPTDRKRARDTLSAFLVFAGAPNVSVVRVEEKLGQRASPAAELLFDGCRVEEEYRLNERSVAGRTMDLVLGSSRATVGAFGAGIARGVFVTSRRLASELWTRNGTSWSLQPHVQATLAKMWSNAILARNAYVSAAMAQRRFGLISLLESEVLRAFDRIVPPRLTQGALVEKLMAWDGIDREARRLLDNLPESDLEIASAYGSSTKVQTGELALRNCELSFELFGFEATRESHGLAKYWRDARLLCIYEGTNEICTLDVAHKLQSIEKRAMAHDC